MSRYTRPTLRPTAETETAPGAYYWRGDGSELQITRIDTRHVYTWIVVCLCHALGTAESPVCQGHQLGRFVRWDGDLWRRHCADGWIRQIDRPVARHPAEPDSRQEAAIP